MKDVTKEPCSEQPCHMIKKLAYCAPLLVALVSPAAPALACGSCTASGLPGRCPRGYHRAIAGSWGLSVCTASSLYVLWCIGVCQRSCRLEP